MSSDLAEVCASLKLPTVARELAPRLAAAGHADAVPHVLSVLQLEVDDRHGRRVARLRAASHLPPGKTFDTLDPARFGRPLMARLRALATGEFLEEGGNALLFGRPGGGKSHAAAAVGHALVDAGRPVLYVPTYQLVQELLAAKRDLGLPRALRRLDAGQSSSRPTLGPAPRS